MYLMTQYLSGFYTFIQKKKEKISIFHPCYVFEFSCLNEIQRKNDITDNTTLPQQQQQNI